MNGGPYIVRKVGNSYTIGVPPDIGQRLVGQQFHFRLTDEGFSFDVAAPVEEPQWLQAAAKRSRRKGAAP